MSEHHRRPAWQKARAKARPRIEVMVRAGAAVCVNCGWPVVEGQRWQVGHIVDASIAKTLGWTEEQINHQTNLGATHAKGPGQRACNQVAGGRLGAARTNARRAAERTDDRRIARW